MSYEREDKIKRILDEPNRDGDRGRATEIAALDGVSEFEVHREISSLPDTDGDRAHLARRLDRRMGIEWPE